MEVIVLNQSKIEDAQYIVDEKLSYKSKSKEEVVFVADLDAVSMEGNEKFLWKYIEKLELSVEKQLKIKICQELHQLNAKLIYRQKTDEKAIEVHSFSELLRNLDMENGTDVIVLRNNCNDAELAEVKTQVIDVIQQLIYLNFSLTKIHVMSEYEMKNMKKTQNFEKNIHQYIQAAEESQKLLTECPDDESGLKAKVLNYIREIKSCLEEADKTIPRIAVTGVRKPGKSMIVNGMLGQEITFSRLVLPMPNCCAYRKINGEKYVLGYNGERLEFDTQHEVREYIKNEFEKAVHYDYHIPDMYIGCPDNHSELMQYIIYDTPSPDIGQFNRSASIQFADVIRKADVIIFTVDYSRPPMQSELDYLKEVKEIFTKNGKQYSLILNVNKLDLRYNSEDAQKNTVWILDQIKQDLIKLSSEFRNSVVSGTSALTYFNAIAVPSIHAEGHADCSILSDSEDFKNDFDDLLDDYAGTGEMSALSQLDDVMYVLRKFHQTRLNSLEEIKEFSGMPNMLEYVRYVTARTERLYRLMNHIDNIQEIMRNLFRDEELKEILLQNQIKMERAEKMMREFQRTVKFVFYDDYDSTDKNQSAQNVQEVFRSSMLFLKEQSESFIVYMTNEIERMRKYALQVSEQMHLTLENIEYEKNPQQKEQIEILKNAIIPFVMSWKNK